MSWCSLQNTCRVVFLLCLLSPHNQAMSIVHHHNKRSAEAPPAGNGAISPGHSTGLDSLPTTPAAASGNMTQGSPPTAGVASGSSGSGSAPHGPATSDASHGLVPPSSSGSASASNETHAPAGSATPGDASHGAAPTPAHADTPTNATASHGPSGSASGPNDSKSHAPEPALNATVEAPGGITANLSSDSLPPLHVPPPPSPPVIDVGLFHFNSASSNQFYVPGKKIPFVNWDVGPSYAGLLSVTPEAIGGNITTTPNSSVASVGNGHGGAAANHSSASDHPSESHAPTSNVTSPSLNVSSAAGQAGAPKSNSTADPSTKIFFWFFPATAQKGTNKLTLWVNGGPGCSSMVGALTETGPISWQNGRAAPSKNIYSWTNSSSILYIEHHQGYSTSSNKSLKSLSKDIVGFLKNWYGIFPEMAPAKLYLTGEAYAGLTIPHLADYIISHPGEIPNKLNGLLFFNPVLTYDAIQMQIPAYPYIHSNQKLFRLNETTMTHLEKLHQGCGYAAYLNQYLTFPPPANASFPTPQLTLYDIDGNKNYTCDIWHQAFNAAQMINPSFNPYLITQNNPSPYSALNIPGGISQSLPGQKGEAGYFNRTEVKKLLHVPPSSNWTTCVNPTDIIPKDSEVTPAASSASTLAKISGKVKQTIIAHGSLDFRVISNGTLIALQNMTWGGVQGFQAPINLPFVVQDQGTLGKYNSERNLSFVELGGSGESVPGSEPKASLQLFRYLVGELASISNSTLKVKKNNATSPAGMNSTNHNSTDGAASASSPSAHPPAMDGSAVKPPATGAATPVDSAHPPANDGHAAPPAGAGDAVSSPDATHPPAKDGAAPSSPPSLTPSTKDATPAPGSPAQAKDSTAASSHSDPAAAPAPKANPSPPNNSTTPSAGDKSGLALQTTGAH